jgi:sigma-B regulation protein RsbU (phosphoserine phosphatase)
VQQSLLPEGSPVVAGLQIYGHSRYCDATGGDYLDFVDVAQLAGERLFVAVGDVTGHGLGAALLMAAARAAVRTSASVGGETLSHVMSRVNDVLTRDARHGMFMTMLLMVVDAANGSAEWVSAGHDPAIVYDPETDAFTELEGGDLLLGVEHSIRYTNFTWTGLNPGCVMFVGTDGVWEAFNAAGEMFTKDRLRVVLRENAARSPEEISIALEAAIEKFVGSAKIKDDITYVILKKERTDHANADRSTHAHHGSGEQA